MIDLMVGKEIGSYRILEKIGQGGMGVVYKGIHTKLEQEVAIKVLSHQLSQDSSMGERFLNEAKIQAKFSHPNVVNILNYVEDNGNIFLVMEYVNGKTLEERLKRNRKLTIEEALSISFNVLEALDFMHSKGVIHRDIKPSNIMFTASDVVKVTDFGIAKVMGDKVQTKTNLVGTFCYMSPEQILGEETSNASDIYSFGIMLYEMITGRVPFDSDSEYRIMKGHLEEDPPLPWEINNKVSKELGRVILKSLRKNQKDRYQNIKELEKDIKRAIKKPKRTIIPTRTILNYWSQKIRSLNLSKKPFLITIGLVTFLLIVALIYVWSKPISTKSHLALLDPSSLRTELSLGFSVPIPEDITSEYILSRLERNTKSGDTKKQGRLRRVTAKKHKKPSTIISQLNMTKSNVDSTHTQKIADKKALEEVLRKSFLLSQP